MSTRSAGRSARAASIPTSRPRFSTARGSAPVTTCRSTSTATACSSSPRRGCRSPNTSPKHTRGGRSTAWLRIPCRTRGARCATRPTSARSSAGAVHPEPDAGGPAAMDPEIRLEPAEARVLGVLVEKALTTPEQYPLTLNAVTNGANQKSNRDPVLEFSEDVVSEALDGLVTKELARKVFPGNSRVDKYCHTGTSTLKVEIGQLALLAELMLRGPQTLAELRSRVSRMVPIESPERLTAWLDALEQRAMIERVPAGRGFRAERFAQLICPGLHPLDGSAAPVAMPEDLPAPTRAALAARVETLEATVRRLEGQLRSLAA